MATAPDNLTSLRDWHTGARARVVMSRVTADDFRYGRPFGKLWVDNEHIPTTDAGADVLERLARLRDEAFAAYLGCTPDVALKRHDAGEGGSWARYRAIVDDIATPEDAIGCELARRSGGSFISERCTAGQIAAVRAVISTERRVAPGGVL